MKKEFKSYRLQNLEVIRGGNFGTGGGSDTIYCKDDDGTNLGEVEVDCGENPDTIQACVDGGFTATTQTAGPC